MKTLLHHRGVQVLFAVALYLLAASYLPLAAHQGLYAISVFIKDILLWILPITVGLFIAHTISSFHHRAPLFIAALLVFEACSNLTSVWYSYLSGHLAAGFLPPFEMTVTNVEFSPLWRLPLLKPLWWTAGKGTIVGFIFGYLTMVSKNAVLKEWIDRGKDRAQWILTRIFSRLIPIFVLGFVARMYQTHILTDILSQYGMLLLWLVVFLFLYLLLLFGAASDGTLKGMLRNIKNLLPAGAIAFTSGCSLSTMPWTIDGTSKNLKNPLFAKAIIPATTNIQQIGDCIINTFLCFIIYRHFFGHNPDIATWLSFSVVFTLARFATAAVIGGAIFIMLPIYESYLHFNSEMIAIILAFNVILDPLVTSCNVVANGILCRLFEKVWLKIQREPQEN
jgi:Na+/H+-dicarboxylate symporter